MKKKKLKKEEEKFSDQDREERKWDLCLNHQERLDKSSVH